MDINSHRLARNNAWSESAYFFIFLFVLVALLSAALAGCATAEKNMEAVAKDWCMVIRASQVVPIYPLSEDVQVGDIYLVQSTVDDQHKAYEEKGFLPMDNIISRLSPSGYDDFYGGSFDRDGNGLTLPRDWLFDNWTSAPAAQFPSYSFSVERGAGLNVAVPVQSIPIALSLTGSDSGSGTLLIKNAKTYGVDIISLYDDVSKWAAKHREFLSQYAADDKPNYVRVVSRVYMANRINVTFTSSETAGAELSVGARKPVSLLSPDKPGDGPGKATINNYTSAVGKLNDMIASGLSTGASGGVMPGGSIKLVSASARTVSMDETLPRPVVFGYIGFDMFIGPQGYLGPPIPTHAVLEYNALPQKTPVPGGFSITMLASAYEIIKERAQDGDKRAAELKGRMDAVADELPGTYPVPIYSKNPAGKLDVQINAGSHLSRTPKPFRDFITFLDQLKESKKALEGAAARDALQEGHLRDTGRLLKEMSDRLKDHYHLLRQAASYAVEI